MARGGQWPIHSNRRAISNITYFFQLVRFYRPSKIRTCVGFPTQRGCFFPGWLESLSFPQLARPLRGVGQFERTKP